MQILTNQSLTCNLLEQKALISLSISPDKLVEKKDDKSSLEAISLGEKFYNARVIARGR
jgi:hypothetical protein